MTIIEFKSIKKHLPRDEKYIKGMTEFEIDMYLERAAIKEFDGNMESWRADSQAYQEIMNKMF